jgi:decaprenyl-phosphate phosphoribosyltransferase
MSAYIQIARPDHWFKNVFMLLGVALALFYRPALLDLGGVGRILVAVVATCLVVSSNYVLNELLDAATDRHHPRKRLRPVPSGRVRPALAYLEWIVLGAAGVGLGLLVSRFFAATALALWGMGVVYNAWPTRTKDLPYLDVLSESINNPLRLMLGWFALITDRFPPMTLLLAYWMLGAFFMGTKRYAEYRDLGDPAIAGQYRRSFRHYTEARLLESVVFYASLCSFFVGVFVIRYHFELILFAPLLAGLFGFYLRIGGRPDSAAQRPERLYRERGFVAFMVACTVIFVALMFTRMPILYEWFNVEASAVDPLWSLGPGRK